MFVHRMTQIRSAPQSMQARFAVKPCPCGTPEIPCKTIACMSNAEIHGKRLAHPPTMASLLQHHHLHPLGVMCLGARRDRETDKPDKRCRKCQQEKKRIMGSRLIIAWMNHNTKPKNDIFGAVAHGSTYFIKSHARQPLLCPLLYPTIIRFYASHSHNRHSFALTNRQFINPQPGQIHLHPSPRIWLNLYYYNMYFLLREWLWPALDKSSPYHRRVIGRSLWSDPATATIHCPDRHNAPLRLLTNC